MSEEGARLTIQRNADGWTVAGELDANSAPSLATALSTMPDVAQVVADFGGVTFMDSSGLRVLVDAASVAVRAGKTLVIANPQEAIKRIVEISGLSDHIVFLT